jgi:hypothetical protein
MHGNAGMWRQPGECASMARRICVLPKEAKRQQPPNPSSLSEVAVGRNEKGGASPDTTCVITTTIFE